MSFDIHVYGWCILGIVISVLLPILWQAVYRYFPKPVRGSTVSLAPNLMPIWNVIAPYLILGVASAATAVLLVAYLGDKINSPQAALLAGYAWDSTLQKIRG